MDRGAMLKAATEHGGKWWGSHHKKYTRYYSTICHYFLTKYSKFNKRQATPIDTPIDSERRIKLMVAHFI